MNDDTSGVAISLVLLVVQLVLVVGVYVWLALALGRVVAKLGQPAWKAWVPFLNTYTMLELGGRNGLWVIALVFPVANIAGFVMVVLAILQITRRFGRGDGWAVLGVVLLPVWATLLARRSVVPIGPDAAASARRMDHLGAAAAGRPGQPAPAFAPGQSGPQPTLSAQPASAPSLPSAPVSLHAVGAIPAPEHFTGRSSVSATGGAPVPPPPVATAAPAPPGHVAPASPPSSTSSALWSPPPVDTGSVPPPPPPAPVDPPLARTAPPPPAAPVTAAAHIAAVPVSPPAPPALVVPPVLPPPPAAGDPVVTALPAPFEPTGTPAPASASATGPVDAAWPAPTLEPESAASAPPVVAPAPVTAPGPDAAASSPVSALESTQPDPLPLDEDLENTLVSARRRRTGWSLTPAGAEPVLITHEFVVLGRNPQASTGEQRIVLADPSKTVSKTHARLELRGESWWVTDLGSTNGVYVLSAEGVESELPPEVPSEVHGAFMLGELAMVLEKATR